MNTYFANKTMGFLFTITLISFGLYSLNNSVVNSADMDQMSSQHKVASTKSMSMGNSMDNLAVDGLMNFTKPSIKELKATLTDLQYEVTQEDATERPYTNKYWDNKKVGIYVDIVSGEPLFSSKDKFDSKTGWPSFTQPIKGVQIVERVDKGLFFSRTELRSVLADSHLGHIFDDGPQPTGKRYCINSASLKFIAKGEMKTKGYERLISLLE